MGACARARVDVRAKAAARAAERGARRAARALVGLRARLRAPARRPGGHRVSGYVRDGAEIYRRSFAMIRAEADLDGLDPILERVVVRMIHACGMVDLVADVAASPGFGAAGEGALRAGAPILCDTAMVAVGRDALAAARRQRGRLHAVGPAVPALAAELGTTRTAAAMELWRERLGGSVVVVGNAPTALFRLLELVERGRRAAGGGDRRAGRVHRRRRVQGRAGRHAGGLEHVVVHGRRGGSAIAAAAVNALASEAGVTPGRLFGVGVGPGRPRAADASRRRASIGGGRRDRLPERAATGDSVARAIAAPHFRGDQIEVAARVPGHDRADRPPGRLRGGAARVLRRGRGAARRRTSTPGATSPSCARATRSSTARTCTCTSASPTATRPRSCRA